mmetsp:Transcript_18246/g.37443  ORF Transcript_18246/g.37443 Transcript_18246/m.37443 type:complete len:863 (-) Transcript_18246:250-2838(-)
MIMSASLSSVPLSLLLLSVPITLTRAVLPPGYEDHIFCPPPSLNSTDADALSSSSVCQIYSNPFGLVGPLSTFYKCYDPSSGAITNGIWTGALTDVTAPDEYVKDPPSCDADVYSECEVDDDCELSANEWYVPSGSVGGNGTTCGCYVESRIVPFYETNEDSDARDPCYDDDDVESGESACEEVDCGGKKEREEACAGFAAVCSLPEEGSGGGGACSMVARSEGGGEGAVNGTVDGGVDDGVDDGPEDVPEDIPENGPEDGPENLPEDGPESPPSVECTVDDDCLPTIRSRIPTEIDFTKVDLCECYADSIVVPFDECEGEENCPTARCAGDACEGLAGVCDVEEGVCALADDEEDVDGSDGGDGNSTAAITTTTSTATAMESPEETTTESPEDTTTSTVTASTVTATTTAIVPIVECTADDECYLSQRSRFPLSLFNLTTNVLDVSNLQGPSLCQCHALSENLPAPDDCQGEGDGPRDCPRIRCDRMEETQAYNISTSVEEGILTGGMWECEDVYEAYCQAKEEDAEGENATAGVCAMRELPNVTVTTSTTTEAVVTTTTTETVETIETTVTASASAATDATTNATPSPQCIADQDCQPVMRTETPTTFNSTVDVDLCSCYASSSLLPFDECEGDGRKECFRSRCEDDATGRAIDACRGLVAFCVAEEGVCALKKEDEVEGGGNETAGGSSTVVPTTTTAAAATTESTGGAATEAAATTETVRDATSTVAVTTTATVSGTVSTVSADATTTATTAAATRPATTERPDVATSTASVAASSEAATTTTTVAAISSTTTSAGSTSPPTVSASPTAKPTGTVDRTADVDAIVSEPVADVSASSSRRFRSVTFVALGITMAMTTTL